MAILYWFANTSFMA